MVTIFLIQMFSTPLNSVVQHSQDFENSYSPFLIRRIDGNDVIFLLLYYLIIIIFISIIHGVDRKSSSVYTPA
jgi:hypothetical protein